ncbi:hypothetical protein J2W32_005033 [Variovorax boronicumulans]|uniref:Uncharacterized protein n=1 Tax=Variovorax boronicumulans TaxID=436515 RepID=A0AAW8CWX6_9BURK|nr:hypothetical protein [Variovorax boronicumulans]MDP9895933.1 hypothetical protein [Variovorax boronicumulans]MDQ0055973.1 hypothetical protein [Variovorax boronicumulans]
MTNIAAASEFDTLADKELASVLQVLPAEVFQRFVLYTEILRQLDYWSVFRQFAPPSDRLEPWDLEMLWLGWNSATEHLFAGVPIKGFPLVKSTRESKQFAMTVVHQLGRSVLMRRTADMLRHQYVTAAHIEDGWSVRKVGSTPDQFLDNLEFARFTELANWLDRLDSDKTPMGWTLFEKSEADVIANKVGRFLGRDRSEPFAPWLRSDVRELMEPLIHPWDSGHGVMMGYDATPEVDDHFLATAALLVADWRNDAGFHPKATVGEIGIWDLSLVIIVITSLHLKHVHFALIASQTQPEISIPESLTIWKPREELETTICEITGFERSVVSTLLAAISLHAEDVPRLKGSTVHFMPLLIDLGNGFVLRPISSISQNPFNSIRILLEGRDPEARNQLSTPREDWLRSHIYAMFQGTRYSCVSGNIKIRRQGIIATDIDAAIFDRTTGELALFQIKWQDFATNDVRQLRSRASNLVREMDYWATKVGQWIDELPREQLSKSLRLKLAPGTSITSIHLFGISRSVARTHGFGFSTRNSRLAIANWPQFCRLRTQIGPSKNALGDLHTALRKEMQSTVQATPLPFKLKVAGVSIHFEDLWNSLKEESDNDKSMGKII